MAQLPDDLAKALDLMDSRWTGYAEAKRLIREHVERLLEPAPPKRPWCETCGEDVREVLCPTCAKWWADDPPDIIALGAELKKARMQAIASDGQAQEALAEVIALRQRVAKLKAAQDIIARQLELFFDYIRGDKINKVHIVRGFAVLKNKLIETLKGGEQ